MNKIKVWHGLIVGIILFVIAIINDLYWLAIIGVAIPIAILAIKGIIKSQNAEKAKSNGMPEPIQNNIQHNQSEQTVYVVEKQEEKPISNRQYQRNRKKQLRRDKVAHCPRCGSTSLSAHKKGFGVGKAVVGASFLGGLGLMGGNIGARKVRVTCLNCGKRFKAGKGGK